MWIFPTYLWKLKLQHFGHMMWRTDSLEKTLMLGKIEGWRRRGDRGWDGWMASPTWWTWVWASSGSWCWIGRLGVLQSMGSQTVGHGWLRDWTELICGRYVICCVSSWMLASPYPLNLGMSPFLRYGRKHKAITWNNGVIGKVLDFHSFIHHFFTIKPWNNLFHPCFTLLEISPSSP